MSDTTKKKKIEDPVIWVYGINKKKKFYEFHPQHQNHIEACYQNGRKTCKLYVFGLTWTIDFDTMTKFRSRNSCGKIRRLHASTIKDFNVAGICGADYPKTEGYKQTDGICHVCLYKPTIPTRIETCGHEFCYMCLKSNFTMGMECPTCRAEIPNKTFDWPIRNDLDIHMECPEEYAKDCITMLSQEIEKSSRPRKAAAGPIRRSTRSTRTKYYWIYQSHSYGWYRYDPKNEKYLEECYIRKKDCTLFIAGYKMTISFNEGKQHRVCGGRKRTRKIKRIRSVDVEKYQIKGIAGIRGYVRVLE